MDQEKRGRIDDANESRRELELIIGAFLTRASQLDFEDDDDLAPSTAIDTTGAPQVSVAA